jgi:hypothetical protein
VAKFQPDSMPQIGMGFCHPTPSMLLLQRGALVLALPESLDDLLKGL